MEDNADPLSSFFFSNVVDDWLENALDSGIKEKDFWEMTIDELARAISSFNRVEKLKLQERAAMDYKLAELIGVSNARLHSSSVRMPIIEEAYPTLFDAKEIEEQRRKTIEEQSAIRFKQFAAQYSKRRGELNNG